VKKKKWLTKSFHFHPFFSSKWYESKILFLLPFHLIIRWAAIKFLLTASLHYKYYIYIYIYILKLLTFTINISRNYI